MQQKIFRYIEKCLHDYPTNLIRLAGLVEELNLIRSAGDVTGQSYEISGGTAGNGYGDPVSNFVAKLEQAEQRINILAQQLNRITALHDALKDSHTLDAVTSGDYQELLQCFYFGNMPLDDFLHSSGWSRSKFYMRRRELIQISREYLEV